MAEEKPTGEAAAQPAATSTEAAPPAAQPGGTPGQGAATGATTPAPVEGGAAPPAAAEEGAAPSPAAEEAFSVQLPEGLAADEVLIEGFTKTAKELGLKGPQAQKFVDAYAAAQTAAAERFEAQAEARVAEWQQAVKSDAEMGGAHYEATQAEAARAQQRFASPALQQLLQQTGLDKHPEVVRLYRAVGRAMAEDTVAGSQQGGAAAQPSEEDALRARYPSMFKGKE